MNKSRSTSSTGTPKMSQPGTRLSTTRTPSDEDSRSGSLAGRPGTVGTLGCIDTDEDRPEDTSTSDDCDFEFILAGHTRHPVQIVCVTHDWVGRINAD